MLKKYICSLVFVYSISGKGIVFFIFTIKLQKEIVEMVIIIYWFN